MMQSRFAFLTVLLLATAVACGDDDVGDVGPDADDPGLDAGTGDPEADGGVSADADPGDTATAFSLGSSDEVGIASAVGVPSLEVEQNVAEGIADGDAVLRRIGDAIYILNRDSDNVTVIDEDFELVDQFSLPDGSNPYDVALTEDALYVAAYGSEGVLALDPDEPGDGVVDTIDLSDLEPETEEPNCAALYLDGDDLLAACQRLGQDFSPVGPGQIAIIDTDDHGFETFDLDRENPLSRFVATAEDGPFEGDLLISSVGAFDGDIGDYPLDEGCIERISLGDSDPTSECLLENEDLGGWTGSLARDGDGVWIAAEEQGDAFVVEYDLEAEDLAEPLTPEDQTPSDLAICPDGEIVIADTSFEGPAGLRVYAGGDELTDDLLDTGAAPAFSDGLVCYPAE